jgi:uncharacterized protein (TIGR02001 family)
MPKMALISCLTAPAFAFAEISATPTIASDYVFNGVSQTDNGPALQASLDYSQGGFYAGVWGSNVDFDDEADLEVDIYLGYGGAFSDAVSYDVGYARYFYPGVDDDLNYDYSEIYFGITIMENTLLKAWYSPEYFGESGNAYVIRAAHTIPIQDFSLGLEVNYVEHMDEDEWWFGDSNYYHGKISLSTTLPMEIGAELSLQATSIDSDDDPDDIAAPRVVLAIYRTFTLAK